MATRVRQAAQTGTPLRIRGGGSKDFYGLRLGGEVLDTRSYSGVDSYEPSELVVTVRCGTPLAALEQLLAERGQCLPFEPPHFSPTLPSAAWSPADSMARRAPAVGRCATFCWAWCCSTARADA